MRVLKLVYQRRLARYLTIALSISVIIFGAAVGPWAVQVSSFRVGENSSEDVLLNGEFRDGLKFWNITRNGLATYTIVGSEDAALQMQAEGTSRSNLTLFRDPSPSAKIVPELAMRMRLRYLGSLTSGDSYIAIVTFVIWNNASVIPTKIVVGNFANEVNAVLPSGVILTRTIVTEDWNDIRLQFSRIIPDAVSYLRSYTVYKGASIRDDFRIVGLAASVFNGIFLLDTLTLAMIKPAKVFIDITSNSLIPMNLALKSVSVNGTDSFFIIERQANLPFSTFEVISEILRPISKGEIYVVSLSFETGQILRIMHRVDSAPRWI